LTAVEEELAALSQQIAEAEAEAEELGEKERALEEELASLETPAPVKNRTDRILETIVYVPMASMLGGMLALAAGFLVVGLPTFMFTSNPGNWLLYVVGVLMVAGAIATGVHTTRQIWKEI
jgi:hypothetical protein